MRAPEAILEQTIDAIDTAKFIGKGDQRMVQDMLLMLEWKIKSAIEQAEVLQNPAVFATEPCVRNVMPAGGVSRVDENAQGGERGEVVGSRMHAWSSRWNALLLVLADAVASVAVVVVRLSRSVFSRIRRRGNR